MGLNSGGRGWNRAPGEWSQNHAPIAGQFSDQFEEARRQDDTGGVSQAAGREPILDSSRWEAVGDSAGGHGIASGGARPAMAFARRLMLATRPPTSGAEQLRSQRQRGVLRTVRYDCMAGAECHGRPDTIAWRLRSATDGQIRLHGGRGVLRTARYDCIAAAGCYGRANTIAMLPRRSTGGQIRLQCGRFGRIYDDAASGIRTYVKSCL